MPATRARILPNLAKSLIAVLAGNAVYFLLVDPRLPANARHRPFQFDLGLVIDAWTCLVFFGLIELALRWKKASRKEN